MDDNLINKRHYCHNPCGNWPGYNEDRKYVEVRPSNATVTVVNLAGFIVVLLPGEATTMTGRRVVRVVDKIMTARKQFTRVAVASNANEYYYHFATYDEIVGPVRILHLH